MASDYLQHRHLVLSLEVGLLHFQMDFQDVIACFTRRFRSTDAVCFCLQKGGSEACYTKQCLQCGESQQECGTEKTCLFQSFGHERAPQKNSAF